MNPPAAHAPDGTVAVTVNGETHRLPAGSSVADVVAILVKDGRGVAVAVGREVVPRSAWRQTVLEAGASVEVVTAAAGG